MATRRRAAAPRTPTRRRRTRSASLPRIEISPEVARSLVGLSLLVLGAVVLIGLTLPGEGRLTDVLRDWIAPWFGAGRWLLPFLLLGAGWFIEWGPGSRGGYPWQTTLVGVTVSYVATLGLGQTVGVSGGGIGRAVAGAIAGLITTPGAFVLLAAFSVLGLMLGFNRSLSTLLGPATGTGRLVADGLVGVLRREQGDRGTERTGSRERAGTSADQRNGRAEARGRVAGTASSPGQTAAWDSGPTVDGVASLAGAAGSFPSANPSTGPTSNTFAPRRVDGAGGAGGSATGIVSPERPASAVPGAGALSATVDEATDVTNAAMTTPTRDQRPYVIPPLALLDEPDESGRPVVDEALHRRNEEIIVAKLAGFNIPARIVGRNAGPVVTQYEVQPAPDVKLSRIEALSDDLAMALAARSLRIEAPIPGKAAVGIEIPNQDSNVVKLRSILAELDFGATGSKLTFALGRNVAGEARAVDLARMPHLLIAGATGSGKSVMVNALIASILCEATPDEVRMILMDLKRVELAAYNGLPHLMTPVITEPDKAKNALKWAVREMELRYRRFAEATARNIRAFNESRADPADRLPYIVVVIDELADLMMREGKNVEDPIVRLAQKARATGIHMVLATQRPSVNVVTGLIKANFPSRIAFAMASQIDSRTILDAPGAEDLIGRGDMLYQPSDLPRPIRHQGVFVSDGEIAQVVTHWKEQIDRPLYDPSVVEGDEEESTRQVDELADEDADRLLPDAIAVVAEYDRASASLLQRRLKIGYARAARIIDQLEARGHIGSFDGSNARQVIRRDVADTTETTDDEGDEGYLR